VGDIVSGTVRRRERNDLFIDLGKAEAVMPGKEQVPGEEYAPGERIRCILLEIENSSRGPEIILSRASPKFVRRLFELEVTEIADGTVKIEAFAREPGYRTKIAVTSTDPKVDPVGACVGARGARVKSIVRELGGEKIDIIPYHADTKEMLVEALKPAVPREIILDEKNKRMLVRVVNDDLAVAIGRKGQNARLTSRLVGWRLDIEEFKTTAADPRAQAIGLLTSTLASTRTSPSASLQTASIPRRPSRASRPPTSLAWAFPRRKLPVSSPNFPVPDQSSLTSPRHTRPNEYPNPRTREEAQHGQQGSDDLVEGTGLPGQERLEHRGQHYGGGARAGARGQETGRTCGRTRCGGSRRAVDAGDSDRPGRVKLPAGVFVKSAQDIVREKDEAAKAAVAARAAATATVTPAPAMIPVGAPKARAGPGSGGQGSAAAAHAYSPLRARRRPRSRRPLR
jgi:transcription antitermination factor NusA-like protein